MTEASAGGPRRTSGVTKAAILDAARERFAADGYERATIRAIAREVGIDPSMVMRYFGTKENLFTAASEIRLNLPNPHDLPVDGLGTGLVAHFVDRWEGDDVLTGLLRVGVTNPAGAERMRSLFSEQMVPFARAVCPDPDDAPRRAVLVTSQILGMALARYVLCFPPAVAMSREEVVEWLAPTVQRYLTAERA
ncbi:TetR family transcriptional regulator [Streptomyces sp. NPDC048111]|uniref:TetR/AcrR family transcriptional regulator n=1 Tax=Streptomyces sp. NPDC048111 TaxID=3365500 RepID=UPI00371CE010